VLHSTGLVQVEAEAAFRSMVPLDRVVAVTLTFRVTNGRSTSPAWTSVIANATQTCQTPGVVAYTFDHEWWYLTIPCDKVG